MAQDLSNSADIIDSRDVIARIEELESDRDDFVTGAPDGTETPNPGGWAEENSDDATELEELQALAAEFESMKSEWEDGATLIRDSYFEEYAEQLADDIGAISKGATWPNNHIDWEAAADELKQDYSEGDYNGISYWIR